ncbi:MAG: tol-pal system protein YbgF [Halieaceae bacterium]
MRGVKKALATSGLAFMVGPFCFAVQAQDYVDVEGEQSGTSAATSFGINSAPAGAAVLSAPQPVSEPSQAQNVGNLLYQVQQLQQEVMMLNGKVEEQAHELRRLKQQSLERYVDLDRRVSTLTTGGVAPVAGAAAPGTGSYSGTTSGTTAAPATSVAASNTYTAPRAAVPAVSAGAATSGAELPGEGDAYRAAYALVRGQKFNEAVTAFQQFLVQYPNGRYAPNAYYWLGELYLVVQPPDLEQARQSFNQLLTQYPTNSKVPDALYKLGRVHFMKGNREKSREYLDRVINEYGSTNSSAVKLAQDFIAQNF